MNTSQVLIDILENYGVKDIFGHPGEQILPFYQTLEFSKIKHILCRNEQGAAIAADAYARSSGNHGVCIATAGPGALNMVIGIATSFKDSVPLLVITGDVPTDIKGNNSFQDIELGKIFKEISIKSFNPNNGKLAILNLKEALEILKKEPKGPIHLNLPKNVLLDENLDNVIDEKINYNPNFDYSNMDLVIEKIKSSKKPLILAGSGIKWSKSTNYLKKLIKKYKIPLVNTYHGKGILNPTYCSDFNLNLGMVGIRGTSIANHAFANSDLVLVLGAKLSERTLIRNCNSSQTIIHINIEKNDLKGDINIHGDVNFSLKYFLEEFSSNSDYYSYFYHDSFNEWINEIYKTENEKFDFSENSYSKSNFLKPQIAIKTILDNHQEDIIVNDAGSHTTWTTLFSNPKNGGQLLFSGGMAPMGYGLPGAVGAAIANPEKKIVVILGDGGIQMNIQELATIAEYNLPITIFLLNNNQLGIIRQWEEYFYNMDSYEVNLKNPDFVSLSKSYGICSKKIKTIEDLNLAIELSYNSKKPYLFDIEVSREDIPLPENFL